MTNICNVCQKPYDYAISVHTVNGVSTCVHDAPSQADPLSARRARNREQSMEAARRSADAKHREKILNPDVTISAIKDSNTGQFGGGDITIKKSIVDSIQAKSPINSKTASESTD